MSREIVNETVAGENYAFGYLDTETAAETFGEMLKIVAPVLGAGLQGKDDTEVQEAMKNIDLAGMGRALAQTLDAKSLSRVLKTLCSCVRATGPMGDLSNAANYNEHFKGRAGDAMRVAMRSFEVNGGADFFAASGSLGSIFRKAALTQAP
jgi:hypothetical protein